MESFKYTHTVQYYETDQMQIVHHSNYIRWFEEARCAWLKHIGLSYDKLEEMGILIPVLSVEANYKLSVKYGQSVDIYLKMEKFNGIKASFSYEIYNLEKDTLYTTGKSSHCFLDKNMKIINIKKEFPEVYDKFNY